MIDIAYAHYGMACISVLMEMFSYILVHEPMFLELFDDGNEKIISQVVQRRDWALV